MECLNHVLDSEAGSFRSDVSDRPDPAAKRRICAKRRRSLERAVGLKKDSSAAHATLGSLLADVGNKKQALKHLSTALKLKPSASVHFLLGAVYYDAGQHKRAIQHLKQATELDPQFGEAFYQLGLLCLEMNWLRKAQECFKTAQALNPREKRYRKRVRSFLRGSHRPGSTQRTYPRRTAPRAVRRLQADNEA